MVLLRVFVCFDLPDSSVCSLKTVTAVLKKRNMETHFHITIIEAFKSSMNEVELILTTSGLESMFKKNLEEL